MSVIQAKSKVVVVVRKQVTHKVFIDSRWPKLKM